MDLNLINTLMPQLLIGGGVLALLTWLVKESFRRQDKVSDRYMTSMERRDEQNAVAMSAIATAVQQTGASIAERLSSNHDVVKDQLVRVETKVDKTYDVVSGLNTEFRDGKGCRGPRA